MLFEAFLLILDSVCLDNLDNVGVAALQHCNSNSKSSKSAIDGPPGAGVGSGLRGDGE